jgi:hypothetical protein
MKHVHETGRLKKQTGRIDGPGALRRPERRRLKIQGAKLMRFPKGGLIGLAILGTAGLAGAHLTGGSLSIKGGESIAAGESVTLTWQVATSHSDPIGVDLSTDGGSTWKSIKAGLSDPAGANTYRFTLSGDPTTHAKIRVCQTTAAVSCATVSQSQPNGPGDNHQPPYALVSGEFTITGTSAIVPAAAPAYALSFETGTGKFIAAFDLVRAEKVVLQAVDFKGRVQATLLDESFAAGSHKLSLALPQELASASALIFRLKLGETVRTQSISRP